MGDHPETAGDGFRDGLPFPGKGPVGEPQDRPGEPARIRVEPVTPHVAVHDPSQAPGGVGCGAWGGGKRGRTRHSGRSRKGPAPPRDGGGRCPAGRGPPRRRGGRAPVPGKPRGRGGAGPPAPARRQSHRPRIRRPVRVRRRRPVTGLTAGPSPRRTRPWAGRPYHPGRAASGSIHVSVQARIRAFPSVRGPPDPGSAHRFPPADAVRAGAGGPPGAGRQAALAADLSSHMRRSRRRTFAVTTGPTMTAVTATPGALPFP